MVITAGILLIVVALNDLPGGVLLTLSRTLLANAAERDTVSLENEEEDPQTLPLITVFKAVGRDSQLHGLGLLILFALTITASALLFNAKAPPFVMVMGGLHTAADIASCVLLEHVGVSNILGMITAASAIAAALSIKKENPSRAGLVSQQATWTVFSDECRGEPGLSPVPFSRPVPNLGLGSVPLPRESVGRHGNGLPQSAAAGSPLANLQQFGDEVVTTVRTERPQSFDDPGPDHVVIPVVLGIRQQLRNLFVTETLIDEIAGSPPPRLQVSIAEDDLHVVFDRVKRARAATTAGELQTA